jgi:ribonucleoside-diphosphate reductase beta chain
MVKYDELRFIKNLLFSLFMSSPLLKKNKNPYSVFTPNANQKIVEMCDKQEASMWLASDINLIHDSEQWSLLNDEEKSYIKQVLGFFAASDSIVNENIVLNFIEQTQIPEVRYFYYFQMMMESVHSKTYSQLITTFIQSSEERDFLFDSINNHPIISKKGEWCKTWMSPENNFFERMVAFLAVEGIFFASSFASIFWLRDRGILANSLGVANEYIMRDETLHAEFACLMINEFAGNERPNNEIISEIILSAVAIEVEFIKYSIPTKLFGMNQDLMIQYLQFVADTWLTELRCPKIFNVEQPFPFMATIGQKRKDNFFEKTRTQYARQTETKDSLIF